MFKYHLYAENKEEAVKKTQQKHREFVVGAVYLDAIWKNPRRWCVEVLKEGERDEKHRASV